MKSRKSTRALFCANLPPSLDPIKVAQLIADVLAKHPKLRGTTIVVTDEDGNTVREVPIPSEH